MAQFEPYRESIAQFGGALVFIAAEKKDGMFNPAKFLDEHPTPFPFLLDEDRSVTKTYGVYHRLGLDAINIAHPATFVIGRDQTIRYLYVGVSQVDRAPIDEVLDALKRAANE
jgi:peroxiredoxin